MTWLLALSFLFVLWSLPAQAVDEKTSPQWNACPPKEQPSTRCRWR